MLFEHYTFDELSNHDLYAIIQLREKIFVLEQVCRYLEVDGLDPKAIHVIGRESDQIACYARVFPAGIVYPESIAVGRVGVSLPFRGTGKGYALMQFVIKMMQDQAPFVPIKLAAQVSAQNFYESLGFVPIGDIFDEDGIDHISMRLAPLK